MFEQARQAMEEGLAKGQSTEPGTQTEGTTSQAQDSKINVESGSKHPSLTELEKLERFLYDGKEWTPKELRSAVMRQQDYTKKTQELARERESFDKEREYREKLEIDLEAVRENPALAAEFRRVYPESYHKYLRFVEPRSTSPATQDTTMNATQQSQAMQLPKEVMDKLKTVDELQNYVREQESRTVETKLEVLSERLSKKYDLADEVSVLATAQALHNAGTRLDDEKWEEIWKAHHDRAETAFNRRQKSIIENQQSASKAGVDVGSGGGVPGQGPKGPTNFKEAREAMIKDYTSGKAMR